jgi:hypothetical protein
MYKERAEDPSWFHRVTTIKIDTRGGPIDALLSVPDGQVPGQAWYWCTMRSATAPTMSRRRRKDIFAARDHVQSMPEWHRAAGVVGFCNRRSIRIGDGAQGFWLKFYPDTGHSFANKLPGQPLLRITGFGHHDAAAEGADRRVFAFFNEHLARPRA